MRIFNHSEYGTTFVSERNPKTKEEEKHTRKIAGMFITGAIAAIAIIFGGTIGLGIVGVVAVLKMLIDI